MLLNHFVLEYSSLLGVCAVGPFFELGLMQELGNLLLVILCVFPTFLSADISTCFEWNWGSTRVHLHLVGDVLAF